jgi:hypothetical protein
VVLVVQGGVGWWRPSKLRPQTLTRWFDVTEGLKNPCGVLFIHFHFYEKVDAMDTYYEGQNVERFLKHTMEFLYARTILELLNDVVEENCYGCEVDHPSQVQHTCLMWTQVEHLDTYFNLTFEKIIYENMVSKLRNEVEIMDIPIDYKNNVLDQFADWCKEHKPNTGTVRYIAERLLLLENRFGDECDFWNM